MSLPWAATPGLQPPSIAAIAESRFPWIALVNSDVELHPQWLASLLNAARDTGAWFAGGKMLLASDPTLLDGTFDLIALSGCSWRAGNGRKDSAFPTQYRTHQRRTALLPATAALYRRELFERVGTFAEIYESYLEDTDLSLRCAASGLTGVYEPSAICRHHGSASSGAWSERVVFLLARNQALLVKRLFPTQLPLRWKLKIFVGHGLWGFLALRHGRLRAWLRGRNDARRTGVSRVSLDVPQLLATLTASEHELFRLQRASGWDLYWRLYFLFTGFITGVGTRGGTK